ncbi:transposase [Bacillus smithii]
MNNKIKIIKRMSYGIRNFKRLRNKALCSLI